MDDFDSPVHPLRQWRKDNGLTQDALAALVSSTKARISRIETGKLYPDVRLMQRIIAATSGAVSANQMVLFGMTEPAASRGCGGEAGGERQGSGLHDGDDDSAEATAP